MVIGRNQCTGKGTVELLNFHTKRGRNYYHYIFFTQFNSHIPQHYFLHETDCSWDF